MEYFNEQILCEEIFYEFSHRSIVMFVMKNNCCWLPQQHLITVLHLRVFMVTGITCSTQFVNQKVNFTILEMSKRRFVLAFHLSH